MQTMNKSNYVTFGQLVKELYKFNPNVEACIIASTKLDNYKNSNNFIDGETIKSWGFVPYGRQSAVDKIQFICGYNDHILTFRQIAEYLKHRWINRLLSPKRMDQPAIIHIGYDGMKDFNGEKCYPRYIKDCRVFEDDDIWNIELGERA